MLKGWTVIDWNRKLISYKERKLRNNLRKAIKVGDSGYPEQSGSGQNRDNKLEPHQNQSLCGRENIPLAKGKAIISYKKFCLCDKE